MGLSSALSVALSGLRVNQASIEVVSRNIANVDTPGYTRKLADQKALLLGDRTSVLETGAKRIVDEVLQRQIRTELAGVGYTETRDRFLSDLDSLYGLPGNDYALDSLYNKFTGALETLATSPESFAARQEAISSASFFAQRLNNLSGDIQRLRQEAENELDVAVDELNSALQRLEKIDNDIASKFASGNVTPDMLDQRDKVLDEIAEYVDITVSDRNGGGKTVFTTSGRVLYDGSAVSLKFDARGAIGPESLYSTDADERGVGTVTLVSGSGYEIDLIANGSIRSGKLGALINLRDEVLTQAQAQLDTFAGELSRALSTKTVAGSAVSPGPEEGFDIDLAEMQPGDRVTIDYVEGGVSRTITLVRVDDAAALPLDASHGSLTSNPDDTVVGLDFSDGFPDAADFTALNSQISAAIDLSNPSGTTLRVLDDGAAGTSDISAVSGAFTKSSLSDGDTALPFFVDPTAANDLYTNEVTAGGRQEAGFAARIRVNEATVTDPSLLVRYDTNVEAGDSTRPLDLLARLDAAGHDFNPEAGLGTVQAPFGGGLGEYLQSHIADQTGKAEAASQARSAQDAVFDNLRTRFSEKSGVNIDEEMAQLLALQNAYGANARVFQTLRELYDLLMRL